MFLSKYRIVAKHIQGHNQLLADRFSRLPQGTTDVELEAEELDDILSGKDICLMQFDLEELQLSDAHAPGFTTAYLEQYLMKCKKIKIVTSRANRDGTKSYHIKWKNKPMSWLKADIIPREDN